MKPKPGGKSESVFTDFGGSEDDGELNESVGVLNDGDSLENNPDTIDDFGTQLTTGTTEQSKISKDARETMQECVTEFLLFVTSEANDICQEENRRTI